MIVLIIGTTWVTDPRPGLSGRGLGILTAVAVLLISAAIAVLFRRLPCIQEQSPRSLLIAVGPVVTGFTSAAALTWLQPNGPGWLAAFVTVGAAANRVRAKTAVWLFSLCLLILGISQALVPGSSIVEIIITEMGVAAFFVIANLSHRLREGQTQAEHLLVELQQSRDAQARAAALQERERLAREMHDILAHTLSGLVLQLEGARLLVNQNGSDTHIRSVVERAHHLARAGLEEARRTIGLLRDDELPGPDRLPALTESFEQETGLRCSLEVRGEQQELSSEARLALYRAAQEALTNIRKHTRPERVSVRLDYEHEGARLMVEDFSASEQVRAHSLAGVGAGYGLTGMRERAELLGGDLATTPTATGFRVELWVPVNR